MTLALRDLETCLETCFKPEIRTVARSSSRVSTVLCELWSLFLFIFNGSFCTFYRTFRTAAVRTIHRGLKVTGVRREHLCMALPPPSESRSKRDTLRRGARNFLADPGHLFLRIVAVLVPELHEELANFDLTCLDTQRFNACMFALFWKHFLVRSSSIKGVSRMDTTTASSNAASAATVGKFKNKLFCFSGQFTEFTRADAVALVVAKGGRCVSDVTNTIQYLVIGESPGPLKLSRAQQWRIPTLSEFEFLAFVGADAKSALKKPSLTPASVTASVAPLPTVTAASLAAADSSSSSFTAATLTPAFTVTATSAFPAPLRGPYPPALFAAIRAEIGAHTNTTFMALRDSVVRVPLRDVHIDEQVVPKNDTMVLQLPLALDGARGVFMDGVRSFVQIAAFAFTRSHSVEHPNKIPAYVGMTMLSLRINKARRVTRHTVLAGQMTHKGGHKRTSHFLGQAILIVVTIPNGERWETYQEFIDNGEKLIYKEGHRSNLFNFCNTESELGRTSAKHLEGTGTTVFLLFYICLQSVEQNTQYRNGEGFTPGVLTGGKGKNKVLKVWRCEVCQGFVLWFGHKTCGNPRTCGAIRKPSLISLYEEAQERVEEQLLSGHYILFDKRPDRDGAQPLYDDNALPPPRPEQDALPPLPPLLSPTQPFPPPLPPTQLPPSQLLPPELPLPQLPPLQLPTSMQLPPPQPPAPSLPSPLPAMSQPQPIGWHLVSESHAAQIDIRHDGACQQLGRRHLVAAALKANVPPFEFSFVSRVQLTLTAETEGTLELESVGTNGILVSSGGSSPWDTVMTGH